MTAVTNRKTLRSDLVTNLKTITSLADSSGVAHVYGYLPKTLSGLSPICTVECGPSCLKTVVDITTQERVGVIIGFWVDRDSASGAEDLIDDLREGLRTVIRKYYNASLTAQSMPDYEIVDGTDYRIEFYTFEFLIGV